MKRIVHGKFDKKRGKLFTINSIKKTKGNILDKLYKKQGETFTVNFIRNILDKLYKKKDETFTVYFIRNIHCKFYKKRGKLFTVNFRRNDKLNSSSSHRELLTPSTIVNQTVFLLSRPSGTKHLKHRNTKLTRGPREQKKCPQYCNLTVGLIRLYPLLV